MTTDALPFVSVIVPAYNAEKIIADCIASLLAQDYPRDRFEVIVVDNGSSDGTADVIRGHADVRYVLEDNIRTSYGARNTGVAASRGELLAFCDADELARPDWLRELVAALGPEHGGVTGVMQGEPANGGVVAAYAAQEATFRPAETETDVELAPTGNVLYRRSVFDQLGGFAVDAPSGADYDFSLRVTRRLGLPLRFAPRAVVLHRHRATLKKLLRHETRIAFGREWVSEHNDEPRPSLAGVFGRLIVRVCLSTAAAAPALLAAPFLRRARHKLGTIGIGVLMAAANAYGRWRYRHAGSLPRDW